MIEIDTKRRVEAVDITPSVEEAVEEHGAESGICIVYTLHTTAGITVNEAENGLVQDIIGLMRSLAPEGAGYLHDRIDHNAHAHLQAVLLGNAAVIPIEEGRLMLGTWQRILFIELDGPRRRKVFVQAISA